MHWKSYLISSGVITTIITGVVTLVGGWYAGNLNKSASQEGIYAEHAKDQWDRIDKLSTQLDNVIHERDELRVQVEKLNLQVENQSKVIDELTTSIEELKNSLEERT